MALNKKEKLFKEIKNIFDNLDVFFDKVKKQLDIVYIKGHQRTLDSFWTMCNTHMFALRILSNDNEKRKIFKTKHLACTPFHPKVDLKSQVLVSHKDSLESDRWVIPWYFEINYPKNFLVTINQSKKRAAFYCASDIENSFWIDFYDKENEADSLTNIILSIGHHQNESIILKKNLKSLSLQIFERLFAKKLNRDIYSVAIKDFEITETTTVAESYLMAIKPSNSIKDGDYSDILKKFIEALEIKIFEYIDWNYYMKKDFLNKHFKLEKINKNEINKKSRWKTSNAISRDDCANLIEYFYDEYKIDPIKRYYLGEVICIIWLLLWSSQEFEIETSIKEIVYLETKDLSDERTILLKNGQEFELSMGLDTILNSYVNKELKKSKRIFSITVDRLEDLFKKASEKILPKNAIPIMPASLLAFPHIYPNIRLNPYSRQYQYQKVQKSNIKPLWKTLKNNIILK